LAALGDVNRNKDPPTPKDATVASNSSTVAILVHVLDYLRRVRYLGDQGTADARQRVGRRGASAVIC
jgi:hypothetical protein